MAFWLQNHGSAFTQIAADRFLGLIMHWPSWIQFSKWPEVYTSKHVTADFTLKAFRKTFSRGGNSVAVFHPCHEPYHLWRPGANFDYFQRHYRNALHSSTREAHAVLLKGRHLKSNVMGLPAAEFFFQKETIPV